MDLGEVCPKDCGNGSGADIAGMSRRHRRLVPSGKVVGHGSEILRMFTIHSLLRGNGSIRIFMWTDCHRYLLHKKMHSSAFRFWIYRLIV